METVELLHVWWDWPYAFIHMHQDEHVSFSQLNWIEWFKKVNERQSPLYVSTCKTVSSLIHKPMKFYIKLQY